MQACFKEALRLFPPGHITIREAVEDLNLAGHHIPKGTWIHVRPPPDSPLLTAGLSDIMQRGRGHGVLIPTAGLETNEGVWEWHACQLLNTAAVHLYQGASSTSLNCGGQEFQ